MIEPVERLQQQQQKYLEAIEWLVSGNLNLGTGRTHLLACAFVNVSVKRLNHPIIIFDHFPTRRATTEIMAPEIQRVAKKLYPKGVFKFTKSDVTFKGFKE